MIQLRELREVFGYTQASLADEIGVNKGYVSFWERGLYRPRLPQVHKLASIFGLSVYPLFGYEQKGLAA